ncbi:MAG: lamin tail domain-containing protein [Anaerolineae bacterium]|nr:lamin tail domain-containing protein [Anaerolineae bacterium]
MRKTNRNSKILFWSATILLLLLSGGYVLADFQANDPSPLIISELLAGNDIGPVDEDGEYTDWIEIYNRSDQPINLGGWYLTDDIARPQKWSFPDMILGSQEYLLIFASGKDRVLVEEGRNLHTNFKLSKTDQFLGLYNVLDSRYQDEIGLQGFGYFRNVSYGRFEKVSGYYTEPSPGRANSPNLIKPEDAPPVESFAAGSVYDDAAPTSNVTLQVVAPNGPLRISEIMYNPDSGSDYEFIELYNAGDVLLDLSGIYFEGIEYTFKYGTATLAPDEYLVIARNAELFAERYPNATLHDTFDGNLSNSGEQIVLRDLLGNIVASVTYDDENGWPLSADGAGDSLVLVNLDASPNDPGSWRASNKIFGSPGRAEPVPFGLPIGVSLY